MKLPKPDTAALVSTLMAFFVTSFIYVLLETLAVPFVSDQYAWDDDTAMEVVGFALMGAGILATSLFPLSGKLGRKFDERLVMIIPGFIPLLVGTVLFMPYPGHDIPMQECTYENITDTTTIITSTPSIFRQGTNPTFEQHPPWLDHLSYFRQWSPLSGGAETPEGCTPGCPTDQEWCYDVPQLPLAQLCVAFITVMTGYPIAQSIAQGLFSKMLGPKPQGLWMGVLTGVGSLSRIAGPIFVSYVYTNLGTYWCFGTLSVVMFVAFFGVITMYKRLVPMKIPVAKSHHAYDGPAAKG